MKKTSIILLLLSIWPKIITAQSNQGEISILNYHGEYKEIEINGKYYVAIPAAELKNFSFDLLSENPMAFMPDSNSPNKCKLTNLCWKCCKNKSEVPKKYCKTKFKHQTKANCGCE